MPSARATCEPCRVRRIKCDLRSQTVACSSCTKRGWHCPGVTLPQTRKSRRGVVVNQFERQHRASAVGDPAAGGHPIDKLDVHVLPLISSSTESRMIQLELQSELSYSIIGSFDISHGHIFRGMSSSFYTECLQAVGGRFEDLDPSMEITLRLMLSLGARTNMHPLILNGGDPDYPLTLGITREASCRALVKIALSRYDQLNLWRTATLNSVQCATMMFILSGTINDAKTSRPYAETAVSLFRQVATLRSVREPMSDASQLVGRMVLYVDGRSAVQTCRRPSFTDDDVSDVIELNSWLNQPIPREGQDTSNDWSNWVLFAVTVRLLRRAAFILHKAIHVQSIEALQSLPGVWQDLASVGDRIGVDIANILNRPGSVSLGSYIPEDVHLRLANIILVASTTSFLALSVLSHLRRAFENTGKVEYFCSYLEAHVRSRQEIKRLATYIRHMSVLQQGPSVWIHMTRLFSSLESHPNWVELLTTNGQAAAAEDILCEDDRQALTDGLQQAGFGAGFAASRWFEAIQARGITLPSVV